MNLKTAFSPVDINGSLLEPLAEIARMFDIDPSSSLFEIQQAMERLWINKNKERWEMPEVTLSDRNKLAEFWRCIRALPLYNRIWPACNRADYLAKLGGRLKSDDRKNADIADMWSKGIDFGRIVHLGGDRKIDMSTEGPVVLAVTHPGGLPVRDNWSLSSEEPYKTEADMMRSLWLRSLLPAGMKTIPVDFIGAEATTGFRAHTGDTYRRWLEQTEPKPGTVIIESMAPHGPFQYWDAVHHLKPHGFEIYLSAPSADLGPQRLDYFLSALPRWLRSYLRAQERIN